MYDPVNKYDATNIEYRWYERLIIIRVGARNVSMVELLIAFILAELRAIKVGSRNDNARRVFFQK